MAVSARAAMEAALLKEAEGAAEGCLGRRTVSRRRWRRLRAYAGALTRLLGGRRAECGLGFSGVRLQAVKTAPAEGAPQPSRKESGRGGDASMVTEMPDVAGRCADGVFRRG